MAGPEPPSRSLLNFAFLILASSFSQAFFHIIFTEQFLLKEHLFAHKSGKTVPNKTLAHKSGKTVPNKTLLFFKKFIYLFIFGCVGSLLLHGGFL